MSWGTIWEFEESFGNMMGTHWEHEGKPKIPFPPSFPHPPKKKKIEPLMNTCQAFSLNT